MKYANITGRYQQLTAGRMADLKTIYNLACNPVYVPDDTLKLFKDGEHGAANKRMGEIGFLGKLDGIVLGLAGADHPIIAPEQIRPEWSKSALDFFDCDKNRIPYFHRMILIKQLIAEQGIPLEKFDILPKFPHHYYPSLEEKFEDAESRAFQYLGVETDHHMKRILRKGPDERNIIVMYHDYRESPPESLAIRNEPALAIERIRNACNRYYSLSLINIGIDESTGCMQSEKVRAIDGLLTFSEKKDIDAVFVIPYEYTRRRTMENQKKRNKSHINTPFTSYFALKERLINKGADLSKTHVTFMLFDPQNREYNYLREKWFLPGTHL